MMVSRGWAYSACMPNGAWDTNGTRHVTFTELLLVKTACLFVQACPHSELVVDFVDISVDAPVVQDTVEEVVPGVLHHGAAETPSQERRPEESRGGRG